MQRLDSMSYISWEKRQEYSCETQEGGCKIEHVNDCMEVLYYFTNTFQLGDLIHVLKASKKANILATYSVLVTSASISGWVILSTNLSLLFPKKLSPTSINVHPIADRIILMNFIKVNIHDRTTNTWYE